VPYISLKERERQRWIGFVSAVKYVKSKENCDDVSAAKQLFTAIVDKALGARVEEHGRFRKLQEIELKSDVKICIDGVGSIRLAKFDRKVRWAFVGFHYPKIDVVAAPSTRAEAADYKPLLVLKADLRRWPFDKPKKKVVLDTLEKKVAVDTSEKKVGAKPSPPSAGQIRTALRQIIESLGYLPNVRKTETLVREVLPNVTRKLLEGILRQDEFVNARRRAGRPQKNPAV
jgi:hypothetical protein